MPHSFENRLSNEEVSAKSHRRKVMHPHWGQIGTIPIKYLSEVKKELLLKETHEHQGCVATRQDIKKMLNKKLQKRKLQRVLLLQAIELFQTRFRC